MRFKKKKKQVNKTQKEKKDQWTERIFLMECLARLKRV
jgi:hypothetical protein